MGEPTQRRLPLGPIGLVAGAGALFLLMLRLGGGTGTGGVEGVPAPAVSVMSEAEFAERVYRHIYPVSFTEPVKPEVTRLLDGLKPGDVLVGEWRVRGISNVREGSIYIDVARPPDAGLHFRIMRKGGAAPVASKSYAVYHEALKPDNRSFPQQELQALSQALVARLERTEASVPTPEGMTELPRGKTEGG